MQDLAFIGYLLSEGVPTEKVLQTAQQHHIDFRYILDNGNTCLVYAVKDSEPFGAFEYSFTPTRSQLYALAEGKSLFTRNGFAPAEPY